MYILQINTKKKIPPKRKKKKKKENEIKIQKLENLLKCRYLCSIEMVISQVLIQPSCLCIKLSGGENREVSVVTFSDWHFMWDLANDVYAFGTRFLSVSSSDIWTMLIMWVQNNISYKSVQLVHENPTFPSNYWRSVMEMFQCIFA